MVTLVLYTYFIAALLGRQMIPKLDGHVPTGKYEDPDLYFPLFTALQVRISFRLTINEALKKEKKTQTGQNVRHDLVRHHVSK